MKKKLKQFCTTVLAVHLFVFAFSQTYINEDFNNGIPSGWNIVTAGCQNNNGDQTIWVGTTNGWRGQGLGSFSLDGTEFAVVDSDFPGIFCWTDEYLTTPVFDATSSTTLFIDFDQYYRFYQVDQGDVEVFDGNSWVSVASFTSSFGAWLSPDQQSIDITSYINANMQVRFKYVANWDWFWALDNVHVYQPTAFSLTITPTDINCNGDCNGTATASASGGASPYSYTWSTSATTTVITGLCAGTYTVTVVDANTDTVISSVTITEPPALTVSASSTDDSGNCDGDATVSPSGGTSPYTYQWDANANNQITQTATGLCTGTYCVTVTDDNSCTKDTCITVGLSTAIEFASEMNDINVYPNPNNGMFTLELTTAYSTQIEINLIDMTGRKVKGGSFMKSPGTTGYKIDAGALAKGLYKLQVRDKTKVTVVKIIVE